ncbi:MAG: hypothetical protein J7L14_03770, partial [Candidatus Diapherotrites archaeon]|nr:hypothetical protein [Candidatus Diapherotrites archaeon]
MTVGVVASLPDFEVATTRWSRRCRQYYRDKIAGAGAQYIELYGEDAIKSKVQAAMASPQNAILIGVGHGSMVRFTGQHYNTIYTTREPEELDQLKGKCFAPVS